MNGLTPHDEKLIQDIVANYPSGERVHVLRNIFRGEVSFNHFVFLGELIGLEKAKMFEAENDYHVFRMKTLSFN